MLSSFEIFLLRTCGRQQQNINEHSVVRISQKPLANLHAQHLEIVCQNSSFELKITYLMLLKLAFQLRPQFFQLHRAARLILCGDFSRFIKRLNCRGVPYTVSEGNLNDQIRTAARQLACQGPGSRVLSPRQRMLRVRGSCQNGEERRG